MAATIESRLTTTARALARLWSEGRLTPEQLRSQMRRAIEQAHTVAMLAGTNEQRNREIDAALMAIIRGEHAELDRLLALLASEPETDIEARLLAFADPLEDTRMEGQRLTQQDGLSPLIPAAVGGALGALIRQLIDTPLSGRQTLPRIDSPRYKPLYDLFTQRLDLLSGDLAEQALFVDDWYAQMERELRLIHSTYPRLVGGTLNETMLQEQLTYLQAWRDDLLSGKQMSASAIRARARLYLEAANASLQEAAVQALAMPPLPVLPGQRSKCLSNCKCYWRYVPVEGNGNADFIWTLRPAEHCPNCKQRAATWAPLQIRNGVIQPYSSMGLYV